MAEGILGLGSSNSLSLSQELIDKLKSAERKARVEPIEAKLEKWDSELEKFGEIEEKVNALLAAVTDLDLYNNKGTNAFEQIVANTSGTSAMFEAVDTSLLSPGMTTIDVTQLAKRDVFQTATFSDPSSVISADANDKISITIGTGTPIEFDLNQSYTDLANEINTTTGLSANIEQVGDGSYRIIIKSTDSGTANALTITPAGTDILDLSNVANHVQTAQNMKAKVDGVDYDVSSNTITVQGGLNITAVAAGISTINIEKDNTAIAPAIQAMVDKYNDLVDIIDSELFSSDSVIEDTSSMRLLLSTVKNQMFGGYGDSGDLRLFNYGLELDKTGKIIVDTKKLGEAVLNNPDELKELFIGKAESKGLGTLLKETLDEMSRSNGLLSLYGDNMTKRKETLESDQTKAIDQLDAKYLQLAQQFASYTAIISQMENSFGSLKMMIEQSTAS
ncbi:MAG: flagellar filament capping protein FliD [Arcobacteraceae bacterium]|nr:flagellar filament capping protein FliD [Arcobacteraceae bacterium]